MSEVLFSDNARRHQEFLLEHPRAPRYNFTSSDLLDHRHLAEVKEFARTPHLFWREGELPEWVPGLVQRLYARVPYYREMGDAPTNFSDIPPISRSQLAEHPELLVPDDLGLEDLTVYSTSGTTGTALKIPTDPAVSSKTLVLMEQMMSHHGARLPRGAGKVAVAALFCQEDTLTYPSLSRYLGEASTLKLNLHENSWRERTDRATFLQELSPAVLTGCPFSLAVAAEIAPELSPRAVFSSATALTEGLRTRLTEAFGCPVFDVYSLTEAKFVAARGEGPGHDLLGGDLFVEILDPEGRVLPAGERGEITVTGGRNRYLPLLRYRTGDYAALEYRGNQPYLSGLQGRSNPTLHDGRGREIPSLDVVHALKELPLVGFSFQQTPNHEYHLEYAGPVEPEAVTQALQNRLALNGQAVRKDSWQGKPQQFLGL
ncbi:MAG: AMP-binding protein [Vulcanimicrobiota bacterium]